MTYIDVQAAELRFEAGVMWWFAPDLILAAEIIGGQVKWGNQYKDVWDGETIFRGNPLEGLYVPQRGFGAAWNEDPELQERLGWAVEPQERSYVGTAEKTDSEWGILRADKTPLIVPISGPGGEPVEPPSAPGIQEPGPGLEHWMLPIVDNTGFNLSLFVAWNWSESHQRLRIMLAARFDPESRNLPGIEFEGDRVMVVSGDIGWQLWEYLKLVGNELPLET